MLSASANKLNKLKSQAGNYAALIMEELDPDHQGYIEVFDFILVYDLPSTKYFYVVSFILNRFCFNTVVATRNVAKGNGDFY